jgi:hypothetical protein
MSNRCVGTVLEKSETIVMQSQLSGVSYIGV